MITEDAPGDTGLVVGDCADILCRCSTTCFASGFASATEK